MADSVVETLTRPLEWVESVKEAIYSAIHAIDGVRMSINDIRDCSYTTPAYLVKTRCWTGTLLT